MRSFRSLRAGLVAGLLLIAAVCSAASIDATPGRKYKLTKEHGPWMIMVASIHEPPAQRKQEGMSPEEAADKLVYELRKKGIPAYTYVVDEVSKDGEVTNRLGRQVKSSYRAQRSGIGVIAGNYGSPEDKVAKQTLAFIKDFVPASWKQDATLRPTPGQPKPLSGAFFTLNPLLSPEEISKAKSDPLLVKINTGEYSIMDNKGKYTLVVATFTGKSQTAVGDQKYKRLTENFKVSNSLGEAAESAWMAAKMLREGMVKGKNEGKKFDAYIYHDRHASYVTVGSFDSAKDPRIEQFAQLFGAKYSTTPEGKQVTIGESLPLPGRPLPLVFDPKPKLIEVPHLK